LKKDVRIVRGFDFLKIITLWEVIMKTLKSNKKNSFFIIIFTLLMSLQGFAGESKEEDQLQSLKAALMEQKLIVRDGFVTEFGTAVSMDPILNRAVVGARSSRDGGSLSGVAYIFEQDNGNWTQTAKLISYDSQYGQYYGNSVSIDGDWVVVGAPTISSQTKGFADIFHYNGTQWQFHSRLFSNDVTNGNDFGRSVSIVGNSLLVSDPLGLDDSNPQVSTGSVSEFQYDSNTDSWLLVTKIFAADKQEGDHFGINIDLDFGGNRVVIGAFETDDNGTGSGSVYVFDKSGSIWLQSAELSGSETGAGDSFGGKVAISGDIIVATTFDPSDFTNNKVYIFENLGGTWQETAQLSDANNDVDFGSAIDVDNGIVVVSRYYNSQLQISPGYFFYQKNGSQQWQLEQSIVDTANKIGSNAIDIHEDRMFSARRSYQAYYHENIPDVLKSGSSIEGSLCSINPCTWTLQQTFYDNDVTNGDGFGIAMDISGNFAIVGAYQDDDRGVDAGAAYIFEYSEQLDNWYQARKLTALDGADNDAFGRSVAIDGNRAVVGAFADDIYNPVTMTDNVNAGSVYVFDYDGTKWLQSAKLTGDGFINSAGDLFGYAVDVKGNRIIAGAHLDNENGNDAGSVFVYDFDGNNWIETQKIMPADSNPGDEFGYSISMDGNRVLIGAYKNDERDTNTGAAYLYQYDPIIAMGYLLQDKLLPNNIVGDAGEYFGTAVSLKGNHAMIGAFYDDTPTTNDDAGSVYYFRKSSTTNDWNQSQVLTASDHEPNDRFGYSVSLFGNQVLIGSWLDDDNGTDSGSVYLFNQNPNTLYWTEYEKIVPDDGGSTDYFGVSVALTDQWTMVGAHRFDQISNTDDSGTVYVFVDDVIFKNGFE